MGDCPFPASKSRAPRAGLFQVVRERTGSAIEAPGEYRYCNVLLVERLNLSGGHELRKAIPISGGALKRLVLQGRESHRSWYPTSMPQCRLAAVEEAFRRHFDAQHGPIFAQIFRQEEVTGDSRKSRGASHRNEHAINDGPNGSGKLGITTEVVLDGVENSSFAHQWDSFTTPKAR